MRTSLVLRSDYIVNIALAKIAGVRTSGRPTIALVAEALGTSPRTLQRQLAQYGLTFSALLESCAKERATIMVAESDDTLHDIATSLGYRDASSFSRAFRRWTGHSPREYRQLSGIRAQRA